MPCPEVNRVQSSGGCLKVPRNTCNGKGVLWAANVPVAFEDTEFTIASGSVLATRMANRQGAAHQQLTLGNNNPVPWCLSTSPSLSLEAEYLIALHFQSIVVSQECIKVTGAQRYADMTNGVTVG